MITTVINFCTFDWRCIGKCIEEAKKFSSQIIVPVCDHFFNGQKDDRFLLDAVYRKHKDVAFIEYPYLNDRLYDKYTTCSPEHHDWIAYWCSTSRYISFFYVNPETEYLLFIDGDEIYNGDEMRKWMQTPEFASHDRFRFETHYYFRQARYQATTTYKGGLMAKKELITPGMLLNPWERFGTFSEVKGNALENVRGIDQEAIVHHYSWVRTEDECLRKANSWSHHWEKNWTELIKEEFSREFNGTDFVLGFNYREVEPYFDPFSVTEKDYPRLKEKEKFDHVRIVDEEEIFAKQLEYEFL